MVYYNQKRPYYDNYKNKDVKWVKTKRNINIGIEVCIEEKKEVLNYLYSHIDINNIKYGILKTVEDTNILKQFQFHVSLHFHGYNYLLIIKNINSTKPSIYLISKLELRSNYYNINNINIFKLNYKDNLEELNDTILDGKIIYKKEEKLFLINDILYHKSIKLLTMKLIDKFKLIDSDIEFLNNYTIDNFTCKLIKIYKYSDMQELIFNKIKNTDFKINGIMFLPQRTGKYYIYINDSEFEIIKNTPNTITTTNIVLSNIENSNDKELLLLKTDIVDVYNVYSTDKLYRLGIASVPSIEYSHKLREYFENNNELVIKCFYNEKFSKWQPILVI